MDLLILLQKSILFQHRYLIFIAIITIVVIYCVCRIISFAYWLFKKTDVGNLKNLEEKGNEVEDFTPALEDKEHIQYKGATITLPGGAQQFYEMVKNRRSVRAFKSQPVPSIDLIRTCIGAAGTAPSGAHTEPWTFCIISSSEVKYRIREIVEFEEEINYKHRMHRQWTTDLRPLRTTYVKPYLTDAPYIIAIFKQTYGFTKEGKRKQHYYNEISVSIAIGILLCALQAAGLSSLVTTPLNCGPSLRNLLNRPQNEKLLALLPVGYPADDCKIPDLNRKHLNDIVSTY